MTHAHKDGNIRELRDQFERSKDGQPSSPTGGILRKKSAYTPHHGVEAQDEQTGDDKSSLKMIKDNKIVHRWTNAFENGNKSQQDDPDHAVPNLKNTGAGTRHSEIVRRPPSHIAGRPPLPSKPPGSDPRTKVLSQKPVPKKKVFDKEKSPVKVAIQRAADQHETKNPSGHVLPSVTTGKLHKDDQRFNDEAAYATISGEDWPLKSSQVTNAPSGVKDRVAQLQQPTGDDLYAKVDVTKKKKYREAHGLVPDSSASQPSNQKDSKVEEDGGGEYASLRVSVSSAGGSDSESGMVSPKSPAPRKPPRTFAHDDYLAQRELKKQQKRKTRDSERGRLHDVEEYEEVNVDDTHHDNGQVQSGDSNKQSRALQRRPSNDANVSKVDHRKRPSDRPPPPPRPPPPNPRATVAGFLPLSDPKRREKPFIQVLEHNKRQPHDAFLPRGKLSNPSYEADWEIIRIKSPQKDGSSGGMKRCKSDEYLYADPLNMNHRKEPVYSEPFDRVNIVPGSEYPPDKPRPVVDSEGYAIPDVDHSAHSALHRQNTVIDGKMARQKYDTMGVKGNKRSPNHPPGAKLRPARNKKPHVQEKLSRAYSVLRLNLMPREGATQEKEDKDDSDNEVDLEEHEKRLIYVSTVKLRLSMAVQQSPRHIPPELSLNLFNYAVIIGLEKIGDSIRYQTKPMFSFPKQDQNKLNIIAQFCFPDLQAWRPVTQYKSETFSFVLTDELARRQYGYCLRFLPDGSGNRLPVVVCIVSALQAFTFYEKLLTNAKNKLKLSEDHAETLLQAAFATHLPNPGQEAWITSMGIKDKKETLFIKRPMDSRFENVSFEALLKNLSIDNLIKIFASILLERKLIFVAQHLSTLTSCIHALCALLYPFVWPHPFIPVLPENMVEVCGSPTPILVGVLTTVQPKLAEIPLDEVLMVDLDHNTLMKSQGDESRIIPKKLQKALKLSLKDDGDTDSSRDMLVMESFLRFFVETMGHYTEYMCTQMNGEKIFEKKSFINSVSSKSIHYFLEWFTETQMFEVFITDRMENMDSPGLFENRIHDYREEMRESPNLKQNMREVGRKMKDFFIASGDKLKKTFSRGNVFI